MLLMLQFGGQTFKIEEPCVYLCMPVSTASVNDYINYVKAYVNVAKKMIINKFKSRQGIHVAIYVWCVCPYARLEACERARSHVST